MLFASGGPDSCTGMGYHRKPLTPMIGLAHDASIAVPPAAATLARNSRRDIPANGLLLIGHNPFGLRYLLLVAADGKCATAINNDAITSVSCRGFPIVIKGVPGFAGVG
jgi:hypothetical protein